MKFLKAIFATIIFVFLLFSIYYLHVTFFTINVVFYAAIADGVFAAVLTAAILFFGHFFKVLNLFEKTQLSFIFLLLGYAFAITIPTVIDRSLSLYILEKLEQRGGGIKQNNFEEVFTKEYVKEDRLVDVRLTEQLESGTIIIQHGCVKLTPKGEQIASFSRFFKRNLLPKKRLLMGEYSDDLTDPFRNSTHNVSYTCQ